jgi:hypothetical protein
LIDPGSEFRVHRQWFDQSAMGELLEADFGVAEKDRLYRCLDRILEHKAALFQHVRGKLLLRIGAARKAVVLFRTTPPPSTQSPVPEPCSFIGQERARDVM